MRFLTSLHWFVNSVVYGITRRRNRYIGPPPNQNPGYATAFSLTTYYRLHVLTILLSKTSTSVSWTSLRLTSTFDLLKLRHLQYFDGLATLVKMPLPKSCSVRNYCLRFDKIDSVYRRRNCAKCTVQMCAIPLRFLLNREGHNCAHYI